MASFVQSLCLLVRIFSSSEASKVSNLQFYIIPHNAGALVMCLVKSHKNTWYFFPALNFFLLGFRFFGEPPKLKDFARVGVTKFEWREKCESQQKSQSVFV